VQHGAVLGRVDGQALALGLGLFEHARFCGQFEQGLQHFGRDLLAAGIELQAGDLELQAGLAFAGRVGQQLAQVRQRLIGQALQPLPGRSLLGG
jgi:hypothetical protein